MWQFTALGETQAEAGYPLLAGQELESLPGSFALPSPLLHVKEALTHNCPCCSSGRGNLGVLEPLMDRDLPLQADLQAMQDAAHSHAFESLYVNLPAICGSLVLLSILLALLFERVLGLDRWLASQIKKQKEARIDKERRSIMDARQALAEQQRLEQIESLKRSFDGDSEGT